jgi:hypothetical protein
MPPREPASVFGGSAFMSSVPWASGHRLHAGPSTNHHCRLLRVANGRAKLSIPQSRFLRTQTGVSGKTEKHAGFLWLSYLPLEAGGTGVAGSGGGETGGCIDRVRFDQKSKDICPSLYVDGIEKVITSAKIAIRVAATTPKIMVRHIFVRFSITGFCSANFAFIASSSVRIFSARLCNDRISRLMPLMRSLPISLNPGLLKIWFSVDSRSRSQNHILKKRSFSQTWTGDGLAL